jgi:tetratricopeptide (TPR) repeat protein
VLNRFALYFSGIALFALFVTSCSTKKNTVVSRAYHNMTARYNGYYYSCENISDGVYKIEKENKENFDKLLPVYIYPAPDKAKNTFPEFDKAIKKSTFCIQRHAIKDKKGNEITTAGKWIDNNWINIGISQFYKREFFSAIQSFEYVVSAYNKSKDKYVAMIWLIKAYNEIGSVSSAEPIISFLKNERKLPREVSNELPVVMADYYVRRGQNTEASARLMEATRNNTPILGIPKKKRARYSFITAQLFERAKDHKRAIEQYKKTIKLKPNYEMVFYSKIHMARLLDVKRNNSEKTKKELLKMSKEFKNNEYYDVIYYTLGEIEEKERNQERALYYYKRSVQTSVSNPNQKALSYLKLGEINFDLTNYQPAEAYYDSAVTTLSKDHPDYNLIVARKKTLETLVGYIKTINREDSLQRVAKMSSAEQDAFIDKLIRKKEEDDERMRREEVVRKNNLGGAGISNDLSNGNKPQDLAFGKGVSFYFYDPNTIAFGVSDFVKRWGNRKLEDNWRRSNKALSVEVPVESRKDTALANAVKSKDPVKMREAYKKDLPMSDSLVRKSNSRIVKAYYMMGSVYKEELHNTKKTIATFEELNTRFPTNRYLLNTYYTMYRIYLDAKNEPKAEYYKEKILTEFPDSEFALLIRNPKYAEERNSQKSEVEAFYAEVYNSYHDNNYARALTQSREGISKFGKNDYLPKFEFIKSLSLGKVKGVDSMEMSLKLLVAQFPGSEVTPAANDILLSIKKQKNPEPIKPVENNVQKGDTFNLNFEATHFLVAVMPDNNKALTEFKTNLGNFNTNYYSGKVFDMSSNLFGGNRQMVILKSFANAKEIMPYYENLAKDKDLFKGNDLKKESVILFPISADNLQLLYKKKNPESYKLYFEDNYKKVN